MMSLDIEILEKIGLYTRGEMDPDDNAAFQRQIEADAQLQKKLEASLIVDQMVVAYEAIKLRAQMKKDLKGPSNTKWRIFLSAGSAVLLAGGALYSIFYLEKSPLKTATNTTPIQEKRAVVNKPQTIIQAPEKILSEPNRAVSIVKQKEQQAFIENKQEITNSHVQQGLIEPTHQVTKISEDQIEVIKKPVDLKETKSAVTVSDNTPLNNTEKEEVYPAANTEKNKEYVFNPDYDQSWTIPYNQQKEPKLFKILDKAGKLFFQIPVAGFHPSDWKGESNNGSSLGMGLYFFNIEYADGTLEEGSILVTR